MLLLYSQSHGNIQLSGFGVTQKIFGHMVFLYSVIRFGSNDSNDPASFQGVVREIANQ